VRRQHGNLSVQSTLILYGSMASWIETSPYGLSAKKNTTVHGGSMTLALSGVLGHEHDEEKFSFSRAAASAAPFKFLSTHSLLSVLSRRTCNPTYHTHNALLFCSCPLTDASGRHLAVSTTRPGLAPNHSGDAQPRGRPTRPRCSHPFP
jgi:hypothetical protein